jgi:anti-sigma regulatory factor (Ser/Thr protein kinase)
MQDLSLHILDIAENSIDAGAKKIEIIIKENIKQNMLVLKIKDNGKGMDEKTIAKVLDPFYTTKKTRRFGLGLSMLAQATKEAEGNFNIKSKKGKGTTVIAKFVYDHIDRKPIGNMAETIIALIVSKGMNVDFIYKHHKNSKSFVLDTKILKKELNGVPINNAEVLNILRENIIKELKRIGAMT